jgi:hypothetical protein
MKRLGTFFTALACASLSTGASAQTVSQAFECDLPYVAAVPALAELDVIGQSQAEGIDRVLFGPHAIIAFAVGETRVFGSRPASLTLKIFEPSAGDPDRIIKAQLLTTFDHDLATDLAIREANSWHLHDCDVLTYCIRAPDPVDPGLLEYRRDPDKPLELACELQIREDELSD